jgi:hypothetical protein
MKIAGKIMKNKNVIFFSPHGSIWQHSFPESILADHLKKLGMNIEYIGCEGILSKQCTTMWMNESKMNLSNSDKKQICKNCIQDQKKIVNSFKYNYLTLENFITKKDLEKINKISESLKNKSVTLISKYSYDGIEIGKFALYETALNYKKNNFEFKLFEKKKYLSDLRGCLISLIAFKKILEKKYYAVFLYNTYYAKNRTVKFLAERLGIKVFSIHAGYNLFNRLQRLMITSQDHYDHDLYLKEKKWTIFKRVSLNKTIIETIVNHFKILLKAQNFYVYSKAVKKSINIRDYFKIDNKKKILLAILSSPDERVAINMIGAPTSTQKVFKDSFEWLNFLIEYVSNKKDVVLIIRPHPREFPNKRESVLSSNAVKLNKFFSKIRRNENIIINSPADNISINNIIPYCDSVLTMGSSSTMEATSLGIPCVSMSENFLSFPKDLTLIGLKKNKYLNAINLSLNKKIDLNLAIKTFRWLALKHYYSTLNLSGLFDFSETNIFFKIVWKYFRNLVKNYHVVKYKMYCNYNLCKNLIIFFRSNKIVYIRNTSSKKLHNKREELLLVKNAIKKILYLSYFNKFYESKFNNI